MRKAIRLACVLTIYGGVNVAQTRQQSPVAEYQVKAAFLYNFAKFVEWPEEALGDSTQPIIIGVIGRDPFGADLDRILSAETVKGRPLFIKRFKRGEKPLPCHVLFISSSEEKQLTGILARLAGKCVLTVSGSKRFTRAGGMIRFIVKDDRVSFEINVSAAERAGLKISSRLLKLATIIADSTAGAIR